MEIEGEAKAYLSVSFFFFFYFELFGSSRNWRNLSEQVGFSRPLLSIYLFSSRDFIYNVYPRLSRDTNWVKIILTGRARCD